MFQSADDQPWAAVRDQITEVWFEDVETLTMYYGETVLNSIGEDAFWREADSGDTLYVAYIIGYGNVQ